MKTKTDKMGIFSIEQLESLNLAPVSSFLDAAKKIPLPKGYEYKIFPQSIGESSAHGPMFLVYMNASYLDEYDLGGAIPVCILYRRRHDKTKRTN